MLLYIAEILETMSDHVFSNIYWFTNERLNTENSQKNIWWKNISWVLNLTTRVMVLISATSDVSVGGILNSRAVFSQMSVLVKTIAEDDDIVGNPARASEISTMHND